jgi:hypothetical protein
VERQSQTATILFLALLHLQVAAQGIPPADQAVSPVARAVAVAVAVAPVGVQALQVKATMAEPPSTTLMAVAVAVAVALQAAVVTAVNPHLTILETGATADLEPHGLTALPEGAAAVVVALTIVAVVVLVAVGTVAKNH